jgi:hypothetical protein
MKLTSKIGAALALIALASTAHAAKITGTINMGTDSNVAGSGVVLADSSGTALVSGVAGAAQVKSWVAPIVTSTSGDFLSVANGTAVSFQTPWVFNPSTAYTPLWSVGGFTFNLSSSVFSFFGPTLSVIGTGKLNADGFEETDGVWAFTTQGSAAQGVFSWSSSTEAKGVPDGGTTVAMLGFSFLAVGGISRLVRRK